MRGFGKDSDNDRFHRPRALALKKTVPAFAIVLAAGAAIALALVLSIIATQAVDTGFLGGVTFVLVGTTLTVAVRRAKMD